VKTTALQFKAHFLGTDWLITFIKERTEEFLRLFIYVCIYKELNIVIFSQITALLFISDFAFLFFRKFVNLVEI